MTAEATTYGNGGSEMRVLSSTYKPHEDVVPMVGLVVGLGVRVRVRALDAEVRV